MFSRIHDLVSNLLYLIASLLLLILSAALIVLAVGQLIQEIARAGLVWRAILQAIELTIVGVAVFDVPKFLVEEGVIRDGGSNYLVAARRSLTNS